MRKEVVLAAAALIAVVCIATALTAQTPDEPPEPFAVTFEKIQADLRERLSNYPRGTRNPDNPDIFGDARLMRRELVERTEAAYDQGNLAFLRRMAGTDTGNATELRRAMLDRIEDAYGRNDLPLLKPVRAALRAPRRPRPRARRRNPPPALTAPSSSRRSSLPPPASRTRSQSPSIVRCSTVRVPLSDKGDYRTPSLARRNRSNRCPESFPIARNA